MRRTTFFFTALVLPVCAWRASAPIHRVRDVRCAAQTASAPSPLEECVLSAEGEEQVMQCLNIRGRNEKPLDDIPVIVMEECILAAKSEDEVQACIAACSEMLEATLKAQSVGVQAVSEEVKKRAAESAWAAEETTELEACIITATNEDGVQACIAAADEREAREMEAAAKQAKQAEVAPAAVSLAQPSAR